MTRRHKETLLAAGESINQHADLLHDDFNQKVGLIKQLRRPENRTTTLNLKLPKDKSHFSLSRPDVFTGATKTVMQPPSKAGQMRWIREQEEFYLNPEAANIYDLQFTVGSKWKPNIGIDLSVYEEMIKSEIVKERERKKREAMIKAATQNKKKFSINEAIERTK